MFKKATASIHNRLLVGLISMFSSNIFAAWDDINMREGVTAISQEAVSYTHLTLPTKRIV